MGEMAEPLGEIAGVDADRTCGRAESISGARVDGLVWILPPDRLDGATLDAFDLESCEFSPDNNPLPRSQGEFAAGTDRFAIAALDTSIDFHFHRGEVLQVPQVRIGVRVITLAAPS